MPPVRTARGVMFTAESIVGIQAGTKTQTRRLLEPQPVRSLPNTKPLPGGDGNWEIHRGLGWLWTYSKKSSLFVADKQPKGEPGAGVFTELAAKHCPYGQAGGRIWVKETWKPDVDTDGVTSCVTYREGTRIQIENSREAADRWLAARKPEENWPKLKPPAWRSPRFMPRWASRITLEVTSVRVERLQAITADDVKREGIHVPDVDYTVPDRPDFLDAEREVWAREQFAKLWDQINGKRASWASNPFVFRLEFKEVRS